jgi:hypothetical protein
MFLTSKRGKKRPKTKIKLKSPFNVVKNPNYKGFQIRCSEIFSCCGFLTQWGSSGYIHNLALCVGVIRKRLRHQAIDEKLQYQARRLKNLIDQEPPGSRDFTGM